MIVRNALIVLASRLLAFPLRREGNGAYWLLIEIVKGAVIMNKYTETEVYAKLYPEVISVYQDMEKTGSGELTEADFHSITHRICEERAEDAIEFYVDLSEVEELTDDDDWSDVNNGIENMIRKYSKEKSNS